MKAKTKNPVPVIEFKELDHLQKSEYTQQDTAVLAFTYEDGDGDIFLDNATQGPNLIFMPSYFNTATNKFDVQKDPYTHDTLRITNTAIQPDNGYYKGKSIKGDISMPLSQYRPNDNVKIIKFTGFVLDAKGHKSNIITTPSYTLPF